MPGDSETAVFTCLTQKHEDGNGAEECFHSISDPRQGVVDGLNGWMGDMAPGWNGLLGLALDQAVNAMLSAQNEQSLEFKSVFHMALGKAVSYPIFTLFEIAPIFA